MRRTLNWSSVPLLALLALLAGSALGASTGASTRAVRAGSGSQTFTVNVDGSNKAVNESFDAYFPNVVTVHAGDTVVFHYVGVGEPHTVTLGTLANAAVRRSTRSPRRSRTIRRSRRSRRTRSCRS